MNVERYVQARGLSPADFGRMRSWFEFSPLENTERADRIIEWMSDFVRIKIEKACRPKPAAELLEAARRLVALLEAPEPGWATWDGACAAAWREMHDLVKR
jgi:hypothetical protein